MAELTLLLVSLVPAGMLGFAAHRAGICTVKAVAEVLTTRRVYMLASFGKTVLWIMLVTMVLMLLFEPPAGAGQTGWRLSPLAIMGGLMFGIGAALNHGCAVSTLTRLVDGDLTMAAALFGIAVGAVAQIALAVAGYMPHPVPVGPLLGPEVSWLPIALTGLALWALWEVGSIYMRQAPTPALRARIAAHRYRLSSAAALIGICNAALFFIFGTWIFTGALVRTVTGFIEGDASSPWFLWCLFAAVLTGMMVSSVQRGSFLLRRPDGRLAGVHFAAGTLMGFGAAMAPGGNDALILNTIPNFSPHALPTFAAMLAGILGVLGTMRLLGGTIPPVDCSGDICSSD